MKPQLFFLFTLIVMILIPIETKAQRNQSKIGLQVGLGVLEGLHAGLRVEKDEIHGSLTYGRINLNKESTKTHSISGDVGFHFAGQKSFRHDQLPFYAKLGANYIHHTTETYKEHAYFVSPKIGYGFQLFENMNVNFEAGFGYFLADKIVYYQGAKPRGLVGLFQEGDVVPQGCINLGFMF